MKTAKWAERKYAGRPMLKDRRYGRRIVQYQHRPIALGFRVSEEVLADMRRENDRISRRLHD